VARNRRQHRHLPKVHGDPQGWENPPSFAGPVRNIWDMRRIAQGLTTGTRRQSRAAVIFLIPLALLVLAAVVAVLVSTIF
jgi:hypothetical protein